MTWSNIGAATRLRFAAFTPALTPAIITAIIIALAAPGAWASERPYMVSAANPHAADAAADVLAKGGSAVDAAIAAQMVLGLVEPQSSGIGGGAFMLHFAAATGEVSAWDGRERAPLAATPELFLKPDGDRMAWRDAMLGGRAVGAPGVVALLWAAHNEHGKRPWAELFAPAIALARSGFAVSPRMAEMIAGDKWLGTRPSTADYFTLPDEDGDDESERVPLPAGHRLVNAAYADTLERIASEGPDGFYKGPVAEAIIAAVRAAENPGLLNLEDLAAYQAKQREPVCRPYRQWRVCGMPPPTSGGVTVLQILGLLERFDLGTAAPDSARNIHLVAEASRLAFADRNRYLADPDFVDQPVAGLLARDYIASRAARIDPQKSMGTAEPGVPQPKKTRLGDNADAAFPATSHFAIVDADGNAVSMTTSVEAAFGAHEMAAGFLLNNQLTDFSFLPTDGDALVANRVEPGKRPRSSMSPTIILDANGHLVAAIGSPGGSRIIGYVAKTVIALLDWDMPMDEAVALPHFVNRNGRTDLEEGTSLEALAPELETLGHEVRAVRMTSGLHGIRVRPDGLEGGADPRREGVVRSGTLNLQ